MARTANLKNPDSLMEAAFGLAQRQGLAATCVDENCAAADMPKGAFFHHFRSKDELAAAELWTDRGLVQVLEKRVENDALHAQVLLRPAQESRFAHRLQRSFVFIRPVKISADRTGSAGGA